MFELGPSGKHAPVIIDALQYLLEADGSLHDGVVVGHLLGVHGLLEHAEAPVAQQAVHALAERHAQVTQLGALLRLLRLALLRRGLLGLRRGRERECGQHRGRLEGDDGARDFGAQLLEELRAGRLIGECHFEAKLSVSKKGVGAQGRGVYAY